MAKDKLKSKSVMSREELTNYLESLLAGLKQGALILDNADRPLVLRPSDAIEAELEVKQKSDKEKIELKLTWTPNPMQPIIPVTSQASPVDAAILAAPLGDEGKKK